MIRVLQNWEEIGSAHKFLALNDLPRHGSAEKCWDLRLLYDIVEPLPRTAKIIDLGCSGVHTLKFLYALGFQNLTGVDLKPAVTDRINQVLRMWRGRTLTRPFKLYRRDITQTRFPQKTFDLATCVSVIEHGLDFEKFLIESSRILKPGGLLFVTADYWQEKIDISGDPGEYGLAWNILCKKDIEDIIELAGRFEFELYEDGGIPKCADRCTAWHRREFTFIAVVLRKLK